MIHYLKFYFYHCITNDLLDRKCCFLFEKALTLIVISFQHLCNLRREIINGNE